MWSDQGGPWLEKACGKLGRQEPSSRAELATDEGLSTARSASLAGPTPKPSKHLPFWQGLEQSCGWTREGPPCAGEYKLQICIQRRLSQAPSSHTAAPSLGSGDGSGPSRQVLMAAQLSPGLGCSCLGSKNQAGPRIDKGPLAMAQGPSRQGWLPVHQQPERAIKPEA